MAAKQPGVKSKQYIPKPEVLQLISEAMARKYTVLPLELEGNILRVVMADATNIFALEALETHTKKHIQLELATSAEIQEAIDFNYQSYDEIEKQISNIASPAEAAQPEHQV